MAPDLRQLRHLVAVARHGSFSRAAAMLRISQPALSRSIAKLEQACGARLFDRRPDGVIPTLFGAPIIADASALLARADRFAADLGGRARAEFGAIAFGMGPLIAHLALRDLLIGCTKDHPELRIDARIASAAGLVLALEHEEIEFCVVTASLLPPGARLAIIPLASAQPAYLVRRGHPLAGRVDVTRADLARFPLGTGTMPDPGEQRRAGRDTSSPSITCEDFAVLEDVMLGSDMVWLTAIPLRATAGRTDACVIEVVDATFQPETICVASLADRQLSPISELLIGKIRDVMVGGAMPT